MSKGEDTIAKILSQNNITFIREKTFQDLHGGRYRFDFFINDKNYGKAIIEINGMQHYYYTPAFYKKESDWLKARENDRRKISYCLANDLPIYIIPYIDLKDIKDVKDILQSKYKAKSRWHNDEFIQKTQK